MYEGIFHVGVMRYVSRSPLPRNLWAFLQTPISDCLSPPNCWGSPELEAASTLAVTASPQDFLVQLKSVQGYACKATHPKPKQNLES